MKTFVFLRSIQIGDMHFRTGEELPPGLLARKKIDLHLDRRELSECDDRRSLYKLLHHFSGCSESERLSEEQREYTL